MAKQYVAIDLHLRRSLIVREDDAGNEVGVVRIDNDPVALSLALAEAGPNPEVAIEAAYGWYWAVDLLQAEGATVHLVHPSGLHWGDRRVKNDYRDCKELLDRMRLHKLPESWIAPPPVRELRELVRYRAKLVALRTGLKAQVKAVLAKHGLHPPVEDLWGLAGTAYLNGLELDDGYHTKVESLRDLVEVFDREVAMVERDISRRLREHAGYRAIQAIDGVGPVLGAIFVAEIGDVGRFPTPDTLCSWAGLTPKHRESDAKAQRGHITKKGSTLVRWAAIEAISHVRGGPKLKADYHRIAARRGVKIARVAVARKLLTLVYFGCATARSAVCPGPRRRREPDRTQPGRALGDRHDPHFGGAVEEVMEPAWLCRNTPCAPRAKRCPAAGSPACPAHFGGPGEGHCCVHRLRPRSSLGS